LPAYRQLPTPYLGQRLRLGQVCLAAAQGSLPFVPFYQFPLRLRQRFGRFIHG
jgi:hypothetical protein